MEAILDEVKDQLVVTLTKDEQRIVAGSGSLRKQVNPFGVDTYAEVRPLSAIDPEYIPLQAHDPRLLTNLGMSGCRAVLMSNKDVIIYIPEGRAALESTTPEVLFFHNIEAPSEDDIPNGGIVVHFE